MPQQSLTIAARNRAGRTPDILLFSRWTRQTRQIQGIASKHCESGTFVLGSGRGPKVLPGGARLNLERRLRALETRLIDDPMILQFGDGSIKEIRG